jgi:transposase
VSNGNGLSRGDRNRNARLARLRELVPLSHAIVGIDLADNTQAAVVTDHDSRVIARRRVSVRAWELGELLDWAVDRAAALLRWIHVVVTRHIPWDPAIAAGTSPARRTG